MTVASGVEAEAEPLGDGAWVLWATADTLELVHSARRARLDLRLLARSWARQTHPTGHGALGLTVAILVVQALWSSIWPATNRYGPLEWLWRCATWARWVPNVRTRGDRCDAGGVTHSPVWA